MLLLFTVWLSPAYLYVHNPNCQVGYYVNFMLIYADCNAQELAVYEKVEHDVKLTVERKFTLEWFAIFTDVCIYIYIYFLENKI